MRVPRRLYAGPSQCDAFKVRRGAGFTVEHEPRGHVAIGQLEGFLSDRVEHREARQGDDERADAHLGQAARGVVKRGGEEEW